MREEGCGRWVVRGRRLGVRREVGEGGMEGGGDGGGMWNV
jgi:hypothetical protein